MSSFQTLSASNQPEPVICNERKSLEDSDSYTIQLELNDLKFVRTALENPQSTRKLVLGSISVFIGV